MPETQIKTKTAVNFKQKIIKNAQLFVICKQKRGERFNFV